MKDKTRITLMVCTSEDGKKVPLTVVGKSKNPLSFQGKKPPLQYNTKKCFGDVNAILLLDNCTAHDIPMPSIPERLTILFLPPNVTNRHQPADMGQIASL